MTPDRDKHLDSNTKPRLFALKLSQFQDDNFTSLTIFSMHISLFWNILPFLTYQMLHTQANHTALTLFEYDLSLSIKPPNCSSWAKKILVQCRMDSKLIVDFVPNFSEYQTLKKDASILYQVKWWSEALFIDRGITL